MTRPSAAIAIAIAIAALFVFAGTAPASHAAPPSAACQARQAEIEGALAEARAQGRREQVRGLEKALRANRAHCTDASLARDRQSAIRAAERELREREKDLREAERKGDADKIAKRRAKLDEAQAELARARRPIGP